MRDLTPVFLLVFVLTFASAAGAQSQWEHEKGDCDAVFASAGNVVIPRLKQCVGMWLAYVDPNLVKPRDRAKLKPVFQHLYDRGISRGDEEAEYLATAAAERVQMRLKLRIKTAPGQRVAKSTRSAGGSSEVSATASRRAKFVAPAVSSKDQRRAAKLVKAGLKAFRKGKRDRALAKYEKALELDPGNLDGIYNSAAEYAFRKDAKRSVVQLQKLADVGTKPAHKRLRAARVDTDFTPIHDYTPYKRVTGFARIKVVNSLGEFGEDEVDRISKTLQKLKYTDIDTGVDKVSGRKAPVIWFKEHSAPTAYLVKKVVVHPGTTLTKITWNTDYDIIVSWGNKIIKKDGVEQPAHDYTDYTPAEGEKKMDDLLHEEDKILRKPENAARKINHAVETPDRVERRAKSSVDKVEKTINTIEKTGDKIKGLF